MSVRFVLGVCVLLVVLLVVGSPVAAQDGPLTGAPVGGGSVEQYQAVGGPGVYGQPVWDPPIGGEPVYGDSRYDPPIGGEAVYGGAVGQGGDDDDQPIDGPAVEDYVPPDDSLESDSVNED